MKKRTETITITMTIDEMCDVLTALTAIIIRTGEAIYDPDTDEENEEQKANLKKFRNIREKIENQIDEIWRKETSNV